MNLPLPPPARIYLSHRLSATRASNCSTCWENSCTTSGTARREEAEMVTPMMTTSATARAAPEGRCRHSGAPAVGGGGGAPRATSRLRPAHGNGPWRRWRRSSSGCAGRTSGWRLSRGQSRGCSYQKGAIVHYYQPVLYGSQLYGLLLHEVSFPVSFSTADDFGAVCPPQCTAVLRWLCRQPMKYDPEDLLSRSGLDAPGFLIVLLCCCIAQAVPATDEVRPRGSSVPLRTGCPRRRCLPARELHGLHR